MKTRPAGVKKKYGVNVRTLTKSTYKRLKSLKIWRYKFNSSWIHPVKNINVLKWIKKQIKILSAVKLRKSI